MTYLFEMEYPNLNFEELEIGDSFMLSPTSKLLFEKTGDTEAKCSEAEFGIILNKKDKVVIVANS